MADQWYDEWYILRDGKRHGPYCGADLKKHAASGHLLPIDLVVKDGMAKPVPAAKIKGLFSTAEPLRQSAPDDFAGVTEQVRPAVRRATRRQPRTKLFFILGGCGLLAMVVIAVVVLASGRKPTTPKGPDVAKTGGETAGPGRVGGGGKADPGADVKVDLPDFKKVDYTFDTGKVDYMKGPQGQKLEMQTLDGGQKSWHQYQGPDGKFLFHGKVVQTVQGVKVLENYFFAGFQHGQQTEWHYNGEMKFVGIMKDGKKHGQWQHWHENGKPQKEEYYLGGVKHGLEVNWFKDGTKEFESSFVDGVEHGRHITWWKNGKKGSESHVKQGVPHGLATWCNENGTASMRLTFRDGQTNYDPSSGTVEDFATANTCIFGLTNIRRLTVQAAFDTFGRPVSGFAEVGNLKNETQKWVYRCTVVRNDFWKEPRMVDVWEVKKK